MISLWDEKAKAFLMLSCISFILWKFCWISFWSLLKKRLLLWYSFLSENWCLILKSWTCSLSLWGFSSIFEVKMLMAMLYLYNFSCTIFFKCWKTLDFFCTICKSNGFSGACFYYHQALVWELELHVGIFSFFSLVPSLLWYLDHS